MKQVTATSYLNTFFANVPGEVASLEQIFLSSGRNPQDLVKNKMWLGNKTTPMKKYHLVNPVYKDGRLVGLRLTNNGKAALGRIEVLTAEKPISEFKSQGNSVLGNILDLVSQLKRDNPDFKITFSITPKEE